ncbi:helix-turn-helix transcriptional regulator [Bacillus sp. CFBP 13597]|nr:helix-turn-helix transcriptional regulator [Bacillus sp. CFBP 13597]
MSDFLKLFGNKIRAVRKAKGLTQEELSERCGLQNTYIGGIERGERNISLQSVEKLAEGLSVAPFELFSFDDLNLYDISTDKTVLIESHINLLLGRSKDEIVFLQRMAKEVLTLLDIQKKENS